MADTQRKRLFGRQAKQIGSFAMIQPNRGSVSSSALKRVKEGVSVDYRQGAWAIAAYDFADQIGEVGFVLNMQANAGARADLIPQVWDAEKKQWEKTDDPRAIRVMNAFIGPTGGQTELKRRALLHLAIAGESMMIGTPTKEKNVDTGIFWEFVSSEELLLQDGQKPRRRPDGRGFEDLPEDVYIARMWRSHPRFTLMADSALRRVLSICGEIVTLTQMVDAAAKSRLSAGLLYVPEEITFADEGVETDIDDGIDNFTRELMQHLSAPVRDRSSAASLVPLVIRGPASLVDKIKMIDMSRDIDSWAQSLRAEALQRLSAGLDIDPALLEGKATLNHWTSYNVDVDFLLKHVRPSVDLLADFLTYAYLRPMLEEYEVMTEEESSRFRLVADIAPLLARSDEGASARVLHDLGTLSDETLVRANGFDTFDMPDVDEKRRRLAEKLMFAAPAMAPVLADIVGLTGIDWGAAATGGTNSEATAETDLTGSDMDPAGSITSAQREPTLPEMNILVERLLTSADSAVERALERAASKVVTKFSRKAGIAKINALKLVSEDELTVAGMTRSDLLQGAWDSLGRKVEGWIRQALIDRGRMAVVADVLATQASMKMIESLDIYVRENMHADLTVWENGLRVPTFLVTYALEGCFD